MTIRLSSEQKQIRDFKEGALLVEASPGSGKTRVLTERVRRLIEESNGEYRVLALTFTNKAAREMRERLERSIRNLDESAFIGTLHSFCLNVIKDRSDRLGLRGELSVFESRADRLKVLTEAIQSDPFLSTQLEQRANTQGDPEQFIAGLLNRISEAKRSLQFPQQLEESDPSLAAAYKAYDAEMRASNALDFDDILLLAYQLFTEHRDVSAFYRRLYRYLCVDEAQDLNKAQYEVIRAFCGPEYRNVMMVGDPRQNIYAWTGAHRKYLQKFVNDFDAEVFRLTANYRSSRRIVEVANRLNPDTETRLGLTTSTLPIEGGVHVHRLPDEEAEARFVVGEAKRLMETGHPDIEGDLSWEDIGVLARNRFALSSLEDRINQEGIPYTKRIDPGDAYQSQLGHEFQLGLRLLSNPMDRLHLDELCQSLGVESSRGEADDAPDGGDVLSAVYSAANLPERAALEHEALMAAGDPSSDFDLSRPLEILSEGASDFPEEEELRILEDVQLLEKDWNHFLRSGKGGRRTLPGFLHHVALGMIRQKPEDGLALLTVHSAKGLEFETVFIIGFCDGVFPDYRAHDDERMREERRSAYVAITRAKRLCYITYPEQRVMPWGDSKAQRQSRFLEEMGLDATRPDT